MSYCRMTALSLGLCICASNLGCDDEAGQGDTGDKAGNDGDDTGTGSANHDTTVTDEDRLPPWPDDKYLTIDALYQRVQLGDPEMLLLNVSDEEFYDMGHIKGSHDIPWDVLENRLDEVDAGKHIVIYCRRGVRSESAYEILTESEYALVWVLEGGLEQWIEKGNPIVSI